ncbi:MAG: glycosyltransferase family 2 protein [Flavobacteriales bacterium]|nr:glycosyltransferase family 2 protein [Flavobacteriales bacterium]MCB9166099.1 glycosyltransferase family 2 protein [Flavobacteriales bacterium]
MEDGPLISVIMPAYNAGPFIGAAIRSMIAQSYGNWELLVVNDGSTDDTGTVIAGFDDPRIRRFQQANGGIGSARNHALRQVRGEFLCTFDADDILPPDSLRARLEVLLKDPQADICDGSVALMDRDLENVHRTYTPAPTDNALKELVELTGKCFFGPTWMIRWEPPRPRILFNEVITHAEDLLFYMELAGGRRYAFTEEIVLIYRRTGTSAMSDLGGLERSYRTILHWLRHHPGIATPSQVRYFDRRARRIMAGSYWHAHRTRDAFRAILRPLPPYAIE